MKDENRKKIIKARNNKDEITEIIELLNSNKLDKAK